MKRRSRLLKLAGERARSERGITITELMITIMILGIVLGITLNFINGSASVLGNVEDTTEGLRDVNILTHRLSRDLRDARGVNDTATTDSLTIWVDYNSDYTQSADETISWNLVPRAGTDHFDAIRSTGGGVTETLGTTLVNNVVFSYDALTDTPARPVTKTRVVSIGITYDAITDNYAGEKTVSFSTRLRNVE